MSLKIVKVLNNNAAIVTDGKEEKVAIGSGIGFNKGKNDPVPEKKIEKLFVMEENEKLQQLLSRIPDEHFIVAEEIITYAEKQLGTKLNEHIHITLTDHLSFAIERERDGIHLRNKLLDEIKILYPREFEIGLWAIDYVAKRLDVEMGEDEAAFIALHLHTMKTKNADLHETIRQTAVIKDMVDFIRAQVPIDTKGEDLAYQRLITHLRFALIRAEEIDIRTLDDEMIEMIQTKFPFAYQCARKLAKEVKIRHGIQLPEQELAYITLHIERLRKK